MRANKMFTQGVLLTWFLLLFLTPLLDAQEVRVKLDESTYGISANKLKGIANQLIQKHFSASKSKSMRILAKLKAVGENYEKGAFNYELKVTFLNKKTYHAEVKIIRFDLTGGQVSHTKVAAYKLKDLRIIKKIPYIPNCKAKQGISVKPNGFLLMNKVPIANLKAQRLKVEQSIRVIQAAELSKLNWWYAKGLADTPCPNIPTAVNGTNDVYKIFDQAFGKGNSAMRIGQSCTVNTIKNFLQYDSKLLAWNNIGHGWEGGIVLWDDNLDAQTIQNLTPHRGLYCSVILLNSCVTFKEPLKSAFLSNKPRTYIAGAIYLPIGPSEKVDVCFWKAVLLNNQAMGTALNTCSSAQNLAGAFGLVGDSGKFW